MDDQHFMSSAPAFFVRVMVKDDYLKNPAQTTT